MMEEFTIFPAIDLRAGQVVRLSEGDPQRQTTYSPDPAETARRFIETGATWLHVVNLDGAFGEGDNSNKSSLAAILKAAKQSKANVQFGGGLRTPQAIERAFELGVSRVVLGTAVIENPRLLDEALLRWGAERVAAGLDARDGLVRVRGWQADTGLSVFDLAIDLKRRGLTYLIYTDIARDGLQGGLNLDSTIDLAKQSGLSVIASGGVASLADVRQTQAAGLAGVIVGRALYEGTVSLEELFRQEARS